MIEGATTAVIDTTKAITTDNRAVIIKAVEDAITITTTITITTAITTRTAPKVRRSFFSLFQCILKILMQYHYSIVIINVYVLLYIHRYM